MKFVFIAEQEVVFSVSAMCQALVVTRSRSYAWKRRPPSASSKANAQLAAKVTAAHRRNRGFYGSPRIDRELRAQGVRVSKNRVERLMRENGPKERQQKKQLLLHGLATLIARRPNVLDRKFNPAGPPPEVIE